MSKATLLELADRVEKAGGPDRELDVLIHAEIDGRDVRWQENLLLGRSRRAPHDECMLGTIDPGKVLRNFTPTWSSPECPAYTSSLDDAATLTPEGYLWIMDSWDTRGWSAGIWKCDSGRLTIDASRRRQQATPALALTAAALRAHAQQESSDADQ